MPPAAPSGTFVVVDLCLEIFHYSMQEGLIVRRHILQQRVRLLQQRLDRFEASHAYRQRDIGGVQMEGVVRHVLERDVEEAVAGARVNRQHTEQLW
jgi:hypothetical protein